MKALDERLNKTSNSSQINWPSLDDNTVTNNGSGSSNEEDLTAAGLPATQPSLPRHLSGSRETKEMFDEGGVASMQTEKGGFMNGVPS